MPKVDSSGLLKILSIILFVFGADTATLFIAEKRILAYKAGTVARLTLDSCRVKV